MSEIPGELGSVGPGGLCERWPADTKHPYVLSSGPGKADSLSGHAGATALAPQTSCCREEPAASPCETPRRNWLCSLQILPTLPLSVLGGQIPRPVALPWFSGWCSLIFSTAPGRGFNERTEQAGEMEVQNEQ